MSDNQAKVPFASPLWLDLVRASLERLVAEHGEDGINYSVCESFVEAPAEFSDDNGVAAWHFYVEGKRARVAIGRDDACEIQFQAAWRTARKEARTVYTPEFLAERSKNPSAPSDDLNHKLSGDISVIPDYLVELHNDMVVLTQ